VSQTPQRKNARAAAAPAAPPAEPARAPAPPGVTVTLPRLRPQRGGVDVATVAGLAGAFLLVGGALLVGGSLRAFINVPSLLIVIGGTAAITIVSQSLAEVHAALRTLATAFVRSVPEPRTAAQAMVAMAQTARLHGPLVLEPLVPGLKSEPVLRRAVEAVIDGLPEDEVQRTLGTEIEAEAARVRQAAAVLRRAAEVAPSMGLIGTLVGLVQMLGNLQDPASIGPSMAVALLTTFYGAITGTLVLTPLAAKIEHNSDAQMLVNNLYLLGALSVARQENLRRLESALNAVLPPEARLPESA
jgi:chemotaxis protein MotA